MNDADAFKYYIIGLCVFVGGLMLFIMTTSIYETHIKCPNTPNELFCRVFAQDKKTSELTCDELIYAYQREAYMHPKDDIETYMILRSCKI